MMDLLYPEVKSTIDNKLVLDILEYSGTLLSPIYSPFISNINLNIIENLVSKLSIYTYMNNYENIYINGNINNDGLYNMMDFIFDTNTLISTIKNYSANLLSPYYSSSAENINFGVISNLVANISINNYIQNKANLYINGIISNDGLYNIMNLLYPDVKANADNNLVYTIINYSENLLTPYYSPVVANINANILSSISANLNHYNYMQNNANLYINGNISNDGLYNMMNLLYPNVKANVDNNIVSIIRNYTGNLLIPYYSSVVENLDATILSSISANLNHYNYMQNNNNLFINGNISNDGLYNMMNLLYPDVKANVDITLLATIQNYSGNLLNPYYSPLVVNMDSGYLNNLLGNLSLYTYMTNNANLYINGNISNDGLYNIMNLFFPNVKSTVDTYMLLTINMNSNTLLSPVYSPFVDNINIDTFNELVSKVSLYKYMNASTNIYINGNISNDGLYNMMNLLYPNVKSNVDNTLVSTIINYTGNLLSPYYSPVVANINASILSNISANVNLYNYMQNNANLYINGNISNDGLYNLINLLYPDVKANVDNTLVSTILNYRGNLLMPYYSPLVVNMDIGYLNNISGNLSLYTYMTNNANLYINGNISNDGLYNIMNLFFPNVKSTVDTYMVLTINMNSNTLLSPVYSHFVDNINIDTFNELVSKVSLYKYMNASTNIYINGGISNDGLYSSMDLLFPIVKSTMDNELLLTLKTVNSNIIGNIYANLIANIDDISLNNLISNVSLYNYLNYNYNLNINGNLDVDKLNNILNLLYPNPDINRNIRNVLHKFKYNK
jgi:hypothetical protein